MQEGATEIRCYFADKTGAGTPGSQAKCEQKASGFVRVVHSKRLCPLCGPCKESFVSAQGHMSAEAKKALPGEAAYEEVGLESGAEEWAVQPKKG